MADPNNNRGQRSKTCDVIGCEKKGRVLANLGGIPICYCPTHRKKYGERIINALINSVFNYKLTNFLSDVKKDIFMSKDFLSEESAKKIKAYILTKTKELEELEAYAEKNDIKGIVEDLNDIPDTE